MAGYFSLIISKERLKVGTLQGFYGQNETAIGQYRQTEEQVNKNQLYLAMTKGINEAGHLKSKTEWLDISP